MTPSLSLRFERSISIRNEGEGLNEPSGLTMAPDGTLWTVSDDTRRVFRLDQQGNILGKFDIENQGLEGITVDEQGRLWAVDEDSGKILAYDSESGDQVAERKLRGLEGFCAVEQFFDDDNNGLEGIACDPLRSELLVLKEAQPGLLIAVDDRLERIVSVDHLDESHGFCDDDLDSDRIDFSGICFDARRDLFWIVSDKARRVFAFDRRRGCTVISFPLSLDDQNGDIRKPEGVALNWDSTSLYVVSDKDATLSVFRVDS